MRYFVSLYRENVMKQAASLHDLHLNMLLPSFTINTSSVTAGVRMPHSAQGFVVGHERPGCAET